MNSLSLLDKVLLWIVPVFFAVTVHEIAHGVVANFLGDNTAKQAKRLSLNPLRHIDPVGSVLVPGMLLWFGGFLFGWARPVPIQPAKLRQPIRDLALVALAGPLSNLVMAFLWALLMKVALWPSLVDEPRLGAFAIPFVYMGAAGVFINSAIMMLNLLPFPPLDGGRVLVWLLPEKASGLLHRVEPWGILILVLMLITGVLGKLLWPLMVIVMAAITYWVNTPPGLLIEALSGLLGS